MLRVSEAETATKEPVLAATIVEPVASVVASSNVPTGTTALVVVTKPVSTSTGTSQAPAATSTVAAPIAQTTSAPSSADRAQKRTMGALALVLAAAALF